eukprot:Sspe_Gene.89795::Locus_61470_Transcript_1_1_Confidence_1.000_Length_2263::g.89795::m.89795
MRGLTRGIRFCSTGPRGAPRTPAGRRPRHPMGGGWFRDMPRVTEPVGAYSPRLTRRHLAPEDISPAAKLHGLSAAQTEAASVARSARTAAEFAALEGLEKQQLAIGSRLQPRSNPHISRLLLEFLARPREDAYRRFLSELIRGPVYVFVGEAEVALRESEMQNELMKGEGVLPPTIPIHPIMFSERDADHREDGDELLIRRSVGTLAPDHAFKKGTAFISLYTDTGFMDEASKHPLMRTAGVDRVVHVGLPLRNLFPGLLEERTRHPLRVFLNKWTSAEVELSEEDIAAVAEYLERTGGDTEVDECFVPTYNPSPYVVETWNEHEDKRAEYMDIKRQLLKGEKHDTSHLPQAERALLEAEARNTPPPPEVPAVPVEAECPESLRIPLVAALLQRPEITEARVGAAGDAFHIFLKSTDFALSSARLRAVWEHFGSDGPLPTSHFLDTTTTPSAASAMVIYTKPPNLLRMGRTAPQLLQ